MWHRPRELQANGLRHTAVSRKICCTAGKGEAGTGTGSSWEQGGESSWKILCGEGQSQPHLILLDIMLLKVSSARFKGKPKPHLHIKNCLTLGPRAGGLTLLLCIYVPGLGVHRLKEKKQSPSWRGDLVSAAIPHGPLHPLSLCWGERLF